MATAGLHVFAADIGDLLGRQLDDDRLAEASFAAKANPASPMHKAKATASFRIGALHMKVDPDPYPLQSLAGRRWTIEARPRP